MGYSLVSKSISGAAPEDEDPVDEDAVPLDAGEEAAVEALEEEPVVVVPAETATLMR